MTDKICIICKNYFLHNEKSVSHQNSTCSYKCFRKTNIPRIKFLKTALFNNKMVFDEKTSLEELEKKYSKIMSDLTKISTVKKHLTMIEKYGDLNSAYKRSGKLSLNTRIDNFLLNNKLLNSNEIDELSLNDKEVLFKNNFNKISKHGDKISEGRLQKAGSEENKKQSYIDSGIKTACNYFNIPIDTLTNEQKIEISKKYKRAIGFANLNPIKWKTTHLVNEKIIKKNDEISDDLINKMYSEYISKRFTIKSLCVENNGYLKTKKGWYKFLNFDKNYFYRSSWELKVLQMLDQLIKTGLVTNVFEPERVLYSFENKMRYYYPDIGYTLIDKMNIICEIKPSRKTTDDINVVKIDNAKLVFDNFLVLTENEIFNEKLSEILCGVK